MKRNNKGFPSIFSLNQKEMRNALVDQQSTVSVLTLKEVPSRLTSTKKTNKHRTNPPYTQNTLSSIDENEQLKEE